MNPLDIVNAAVGLFGLLKKKPSDPYGDYQKATANNAMGQLGASRTFGVGNLAGQFGYNTTPGGLVTGANASFNPMSTPQAQNYMSLLAPYLHQYSQQARVQNYLSPATGQLTKGQGAEYAGEHMAMAQAQQARNYLDSYFQRKNAFDQMLAAPALQTPALDPTQRQATQFGMQQTQNQQLGQVLGYLLAGFGGTKTPTAGGVTLPAGTVPFNPNGNIGWSNYQLPGMTPFPWESALGGQPIG